MKKFYILILTGTFLLSSFLSQGQYISITSNPSGWTLDDPRFWQGGVPPPNGCTACTISINSDVIVVPHDGQLTANGGVGTTSQVVGANDPALDHITVIGSTITLFGNTNLTLNSYLTLNNSVITLGNNPTSVENIFINDQVELLNGSSVQLANGSTIVDATDVGPHKKTTILGPYLIGGSSHISGIYSVRTVGPPAGLGQTDLTLNKQLMANYNATYTLPKYLINCGGAFPQLPCGIGVIHGPAKTVFDATLGTAPAQGFIGFEASAVLPVELVQFLALKNGDGSIKLVWATAQEVNAGYYDIERSGDQSAWTKVGTVKAVGNTSTTSNYSFVDRLPVDGTGYYRLKMVDLDGKFKYSKTVTVTVENDARPLVIYNNPFSDMIRMKVNVTRGQTLVITVTDMLGKTYINQNYHAQTGDNLINLPSSISNHGVYVMHINGESYDQTVKLQKQ